MKPTVYFDHNNFVSLLEFLDVFFLSTHLQKKGGGCGWELSYRSSNCHAGSYSLILRHMKL